MIYLVCCRERDRNGTGARGKTERREKRSLAVRTIAVDVEVGTDMNYIYVHQKCYGKPKMSAVVGDR